MHAGLEDLRTEMPLLHSRAVGLPLQSGPGAGPAAAGALVQLHHPITAVDQQVAQHPLVQRAAEGDHCGVTARSQQRCCIVPDAVCVEQRTVCM